MMTKNMKLTFSTKETIFLYEINDNCDDCEILAIIFCFVGCFSWKKSLEHVPIVNEQLIKSNSKEVVTHFLS